MEIAAQVEFAHKLVEAAMRLSGTGEGGKSTQQTPVYFTTTALVRLEKDRDEYHFKTAANRLKAGAQLTLAKFAGKKLTTEEIHVLFRPYLTKVPVYRGTTVRLAREQAYQTRRAALKQIAAKKKEQADEPVRKETTQSRPAK